MKKFLNALSFLLILTACGSDPTPTTTPTETMSEPTEAEPAEEVTTEAPTEAPTNIPEEAPTETAFSPTEIPSTATSEAETEQLETMQSVNYEGISFQYDNSLATGVQAETVPAPEQRIQGPGWSNYPTHDLFTFEDYIPPESYPPATLYVIPVKEAASRSSFAKSQIEQLLTLLDERPEPDEVTSGLPYLPISTAGSAFTAQVDYVSFNGGEGVRYIRNMAQSVDLILNRGVHYTFQGITDDGQYYVAAIFPIRTDALPDDPDPNIDWDEFTAIYTEYVQETTDMLDGLTTEEFEPNLMLLDDVARSVFIEKDPIPQRKDTDGNLLLTVTYPVHNGQVVIGEEVPIAGYAALDSTEPLSVTLAAGSNMLIETTVSPDPVTGDWETTLLVPINVAGRGLISATMGTQTDSVSVYIDDVQGLQMQGDSQIRFLRPHDGETAVSGYPVFFEGEVASAINDSVTVGVLIDNCTTWAARQSFMVAGSGQWTGTVILPEFIEDEQACASVYTGEYGENWLETQRPLPVYAPDDERANRLYLTTQPHQLEFPAGGIGKIEGIAVDAPEVQVSIVNNDDRSLIVEGIAPVGEFGAWEIELPIPEDAPDLVGLEIVLLDDPPQDPPYIMTGGATVTRP